MQLRIAWYLVRIAEWLLRRDNREYRAALFERDILGRPYEWEVDLRSGRMVGEVRQCNV